MSSDRPARGPGTGCPQSTSVESELQLPGRCQATRRPHKAKETHDDRFSTERDQACDPLITTDAGCRNVGFQVRPFVFIKEWGTRQGVASALALSTAWLGREHRGYWTGRLCSLFVLRFVIVLG